MSAAEIMSKAFDLVVLLPKHSFTMTEKNNYEVPYIYIYINGQNDDQREKRVSERCRILLRATN